MSPVCLIGCANIIIYRFYGSKNKDYVERRRWKNTLLKRAGAHVEDIKTNAQRALRDMPPTGIISSDLRVGIFIE